VLEKLATETLREQRRTRRWGIFFKFAFLAYLTALVVPYLHLGTWLEGTTERYTAMVKLDGVIAAGKPASADHVVAGLRSAFADEASAGIILRINSPGGSPVQAGQIHDEILRLRKKYPDKRLYAVIADICASGGYYVAAAAEKIYADKGSIVGSIGVLMNGFGFVGLMDKLGIERRLLTAGKHKGLLDPFSPAKPEERAHLQRMLDSIHRQFIEVVERGRGKRLKGEESELFSGYVWTGARSLELGLVDALGSTGQVAREIFDAEKIVDYTVRDSVAKRVLDRFGASIGRGIVGTLQERELGNPRLD